MIPKWSSIPTAMRWYLGLLCILGIVPIALSLFYPLDRLNALLTGHLAEQQVKTETIDAERSRTFDEYKSMSSEKVIYKPAPTDEEPEKPPILPINVTTVNNVPVATVSEKTDWVGIIGGINSAVIAWFMYFDRRRRSRQSEVYDDQPPPPKPSKIDDMGEDDTSG